MNTYRLYAMPTKPETIEGMDRFRFSRVTPEYSLVYTEKDHPEGSLELREEDAKRLTKADESWLICCNLTIIKEEIEKKKPELLKKLAEKVDGIEALLKEISEEAEKSEETEE